MISFKLSQAEIKQFDKEIANFDVILDALHKHKEIDFCIDKVREIVSIKNRVEPMDNCSD